MRELWTLYHPVIPEFLQEFADTPPLHRLRNVGMNCGCEYTAFPRFSGLNPYSRFDHSMGVALILWHMTESKVQSLAGLFHDIATPAFAHVVDFLNGDHLRQESTEAGTAAFLEASPEIRMLLKKHGLSPVQVSDDTQYPLANNKSPALCADRLEYTFGNLLNYGFASPAEIRSLYEDLTVGTDEQGHQELVFLHKAQASKFVKGALQCSHIYVADEDRFSMEALARLLKTALSRGVLTKDDLWGTEPQVIAALTADPVCNSLWREFCGYCRILRSRKPSSDGVWLRVDAKKRWIDPMVVGCGRVSEWDPEIQQDIQRFLSLDFSHWMRGESFAPAVHL